ncbi:TIGR02186 family protein [Fodinicurvata fenggangensis]|uniref:TIGR02186 family protein n=1 Tax=Fodinicurvata fenggangensis TaxID=1121830 RepID=UPI0005503B4E|nr:TIGR02186 family protein [Fodinicurvata fenggangensis]
MRGRRLILLVLLVAGLTLPARALPLVADLSSHLVAITTGFTGSEVLMFGAIEEPGDIVVVVRGPESEQRVMRKSRVAGIWMNTAGMVYRDVPRFYAIASNRPLDEIAEESVLQNQEFGVSRLRFSPKDSARLDPEDAGKWRRALIRRKQEAGLYSRSTGRVAILSDRLFRTSVYLPTNVPTGIYSAEIYLLQDGQVVNAQSTPLAVSKVGIEADLYAFAYDRPALYGLVAVLTALMAGWFAHLAFRRN